jgi:hypothetical protein
MMRNFLRSSVLALVATAAYVATPTPAKAYQVDCAILLCLSGGWPASAECVHARAVFIRRITPWPIEPPLQIWRCPMGIAAGDMTSPSQQLLDFAFKDAPPAMQNYPDDDYFFDTIGGNRYNNPQDVSAPADVAQETITMADLRTEDGEFDALKFLHFTQEERADIDISGPEFDFVRSIVVWDIRSFSHREHGSEGDCEVSFYGQKGTYGQQGEFTYARVGLGEVPTWAIPQRSCHPPSRRRGVGVEWRSYQGEYGNEWVSY